MKVNINREEGNRAIASLSKKKATGTDKISYLITYLKHILADHILPVELKGFARQSYEWKDSLFIKNAIVED